MSSTVWTDEQRAAIHQHGRNLLVAAAAGAGKTAVLVERVIQMLLNECSPVDLDRLLVVTFTEAAASEMRQRIGAALQERLQRAGGAKQRLLNQLLLLPRALIGTLHSFCSELLRRHFYHLQLDPAFRIMDENEAFFLRQEVLEEVLQGKYQELEERPDQPFFQLTALLAGRHGDDRRLYDLVWRFYSFALSLPRPRAWLNWLVGSLENASACWEEQPWLVAWQDGVYLELGAAAESLALALELTRQPGGPAVYEPLLAQELAAVEKCLALCRAPYEQLKQSLLEAATFGRLPSLKKGEFREDYQQQVKDLRNKAKDGLKKLIKTYFSRPALEMLADLRQAAPLLRALVELVLDFDLAYRRAKLDRGLLDFSDLEHYALALLAENAELSPWSVEAPDQPQAPLLASPLAREYRQQFAAVLVDEYQDINGVQEAILELVSAGHNRFMVGDVKQSIYRFRLADPGLFLQRYQDYVAWTELPKLADGLVRHLADQVPGLRIDLTANFRSIPGILAAVNFLCGRMMSARVAEIDYDERARLRSPRPGEEEKPPGGEVEIHLLEYRPPAAGTEPEDLENGGEIEEEGAGALPVREELDQVRLEARYLAGWLKETLARGLELPDGAGGQRRATWRDVVILLRSLQHTAGIYLEEFRRQGIPVYADGSGGYFAASEVQTVLALLQVIDNPRRDIPLAAVLRSGFVGLSAAHLARLRLACPQGDFYTAVQYAWQNPAVLEDDRAAASLLAFQERLKVWRQMATQVEPAELLEEIYRRTGFYDLVGALPGGSLRQANLRLLVDRARQFAGTSYRGLFRFLRYIEQMQEQGRDLDTARSLSESEDVVRIMSIHRSKGLQFPVVIVAGLGRRFNMRDIQSDWLLHRQLGCGPLLFDPQDYTRRPTVLHHLLRQRLRLESLAEEMRLFYVAVTRARYRLLLTATARHLPALIQNWQSYAGLVGDGRPLPVSLLAGANSCLDWVGPALFTVPALAGLSWPEDAPLELPTPAGLLCLRPAARLASLWQAAGDEQPEDVLWLQRLRDLQPLPRSWLEEQAPEGEKLPDDEELAGALFWRYPRAALSGIPAKLSVTEWSKRQEEEADLPAGVMFETAVVGNFEPENVALPPGFDLPVFHSGGHHAVERGQAMHLAMQHLDLEWLARTTPARREIIEEIERQLARMVERGVLGAGQRELVNVEQIAGFVDSPTGRRLLVAAVSGQVWRELPFTVALPCRELFPALAVEGAEEESIILQGIIDCLLGEPDGLVIIDYKSDYITAGQAAEFVRRHSSQLDLYARAVEHITGRIVKEKILYSFTLGRSWVV
ncbi:helicase-exonuclease AddAB subunit AddA [Desulfurispora thermophila]|uniref:helicase-exonuclease AddAB subunit AddA n=1 Tax=Desulfurispora thermophila TaxID=265470 RepID=UPI00036C7A40|nr:helicase-exonuclease AddAB subunit AddA [Desulfurispora thermophila]